MSWSHITDEALRVLADGRELWTHPDAPGWVTNGQWMAQVGRVPFGSVPRWKAGEALGIPQQLKRLSGPRVPMERLVRYTTPTEWVCCRMCDGSGTFEYDLEVDDSTCLDECENCGGDGWVRRGGQVVLTDGTNKTPFAPRLAKLFGRFQVYRLDDDTTKPLDQRAVGVFDGDAPVAIVMPVLIDIEEPRP